MELGLYPIGNGKPAGGDVSAEKKTSQMLGGCSLLGFEDTWKMH